MFDDKPSVTTSGPAHLDDARYEDAVRSALPGLGAITTLTLAGMAAAAALSGLSDAAVIGLAAAAGLVAVLAFASWVWRDEVPLPEVIAVSMVLVPAGGGVLGLVLSDDVTWSLAVLAALAIIGPSLLSTRWVVGVVYTVWVGWLAGLAAANLPEWPLGWIGAGVIVTVAAVAASVSRRRMAERLADLTMTASRTSVRDPLTGLANRQGLSMLGQQIVESARRSGDAVHWCLRRHRPAATRERGCRARLRGRRGGRSR